MNIVNTVNTEQRRTLFLHEMGFPVQWQSKQPMPQAAVSESAPILAAESTSTSASASASLSNLSNLSNLSISASASAPAPAPASLPVRPSADATTIASMNWPALEAAVAACTTCNLCHTRQQTVFGSGDREAHWLLIGDTPDQQDEAEGMPFTGQTGVLLNNMLKATGHSLDGTVSLPVYLTNLVKCRAQDDEGNARPPSTEEINACRPFLERQIQLMQPRMILAMGKTAAQALRAPTSPPSPLRGVVHRAFNIPMVATWHPAILLRQPAEKRQVWADLCLAKNHDEPLV
jgi:DNA polymerase